MKFKKLVILDENTFSDEQKEELKKLGEKVVFFDDIPKTEEEVKKRIGNADGVVDGWTNISKNIIDSCKNLKYIGVTATGYDHVDVKHAKNKNIAVTNVPDFSTESVAEFVFGNLITFLRNTGKAEEQLRKGSWSMNTQGEELAGKTIGIIGMGKIGQKAAEIAKVFNMNVIYWSRKRKKEIENKGIKYKKFEDLIKESDIISMHLLLCKETENIINKKTIESMKENCVLVNMARAKLIDNEALAEALNKGKIRGAIIDVFFPEPVSSENPLLKAKNVMLTPHMAWNTKQSNERLNQTAISNAKSFLLGKIQSRVN